MSISKTNLFFNRQAVYPIHYNGRKVENHIIHEVLENANQAPSHKRTYPWRFKVYSGEALNRLMDQMAAIYLELTDRDQVDLKKLQKFEDRKTQVSHVITLGVQYHPNAGIPEFEEECAVACAVQNMWLTLAQYEDVGGYWSTGPLPLSPSFHRWLEMGEDERCLGLFYLGAVDALPKTVKRPDWRERVEFVDE
jgi:nitroreductase